MKLFSFISTGAAILLFMAAAPPTRAQPVFTLSQNTYRFPYDIGETVTVTNDVFTHTPLGRYDLKAQGVNDCGTHRIAAAAAGRVEMVVENNSQSCPSCGSSNNYVWIRHDNNEWSKYTHFAQNSVAVNVGDTVCAGDFLGYECWVGATSPAQARHLHFEVRQPLDPDNVQINPSGGFMDSVNGYHLIPVFTTVSNHYVVENDVITPSAGSGCTAANITLGSQTYASGSIKIHMASGMVSTGNNNVTCGAGANVKLQAGTEVLLLPGFQAAAGSYFHAKTAGCFATPFPGGCN